MIVTGFRLNFSLKMIACQQVMIDENGYLFELNNAIIRTSTTVSTMSSFLERNTSNKDVIIEIVKIGAMVILAIFQIGFLAYACKQSTKVRKSLGCLVFNIFVLLMF